MTLYFITGNKKKFEEVKAVLSQVEQLEIDLPEIQSMDAHEIIKAKLTEAFSHKKSEFIVEDTGLYLECLNGLPGPLVKWFEETIGNEGIANIAKKIGNTKAVAKTVIGYARNVNDIHFFEGVMKGDIVQPRGPNAFGWDVIFKPEGYDKTYAEMTQEEKGRISHRRQALNKLKEFLS